MTDTCMAAGFGSAWSHVGVDGGLRIEPQATSPGGSAAGSPPSPPGGRACAGSGSYRSLIETCRRHFDAGENELKVGHLERARVEFDRAVDVLLESPYGARTDRASASTFRPAGRSHQRLRGDGARPRATASTEKTLRGGLDRRAPERSPPSREPAAGAETTAAVKADLERRPSTTSRFRRTAGALVRRAVPGPAARLHRGGPHPRHQVPADDPERVPRRRAAARSRLHPDHRKRASRPTPCRRRAPRGRGSS